MYNILATFKNMEDLQHCMKHLRVHPDIKGHMLVIPKQIPENMEKEISSVLIKRSRQIASSGLEDVRLGVITGFLIGALSAFAAVFFNTSLLHLNTISFIGGTAIIFYGGTSGALLGFLLHTIFTKYNWLKNKEEAVLLFQKIDDDTKNAIIKSLEEYHANEIKIY